jgi:uracil-DNA glycosylase family 4
MSKRSELQALHRAMDHCRLCLEAGFEIIPRAIYSGSAQARVMLIGQAPGVTEAEAGRPFNAGSGKRLFQWLEQAGFDEKPFRARQYLSSVTKCYPGKAANGGGDRVPSRAEQALCRPFLEAQLALLDPALIIPVGRLAIDLFFPGQALADVIGTQSKKDGRVIIPLPHPSGASRWHQLPEHRERIRRAIRLLARQRQAMGL